MASLSPSPVMVLTPLLGEAAATSWTPCVIEPANSPSFEDKAVLEFFQTSGCNLIAIPCRTINCRNRPDIYCGGAAGKNQCLGFAQLSLPAAADNRRRFSMFKATIFLLAALCAATPALAQGAPEPDVAPTEKALKAFEKAKVSLAEAIEIAAKQHRDAKVVDVSFDGESDQLTYKVTTYQDNKVWEGSVDAWTGEVIGKGTTTPVSKLEEEDQLELAGLLKASLDLAAATALAEERASGKAISAALEANSGLVVYEVVIVKNGATTKVVIDPKSGKVR